MKTYTRWKNKIQELTRTEIPEERNPDGSLKAKALIKLESTLYVFPSINQAKRFNRLTLGNTAKRGEIKGSQHASVQQLTCKG